MSPRMTVGALLDAWLASVERSVRPTTFKSYRTLVDCHLRPELGRVKVADLRPAHVDQLLARKAAAGVKARRLDMIRAALRQALNYAMRHELVVRNVATLVSPPRQQRFEIQPLDAAEARLLIEAVRDRPLGSLIITALSTGLRQGELLGLQWGDIDLNHGTLSVRRTVIRVPGGLRFAEPKTERSRRTLPLPGIAIEALRRQRAVLLDAFGISGVTGEALVFPSVKDPGKPLDGTWVTKAFQRELEAAGIRRVRFHDLRHTAATLLLAQGVSAREIMEVLGHSQISLTLNTYAHVLGPAKERVASLMDLALAEAR